MDRKIFLAVSSALLVLVVVLAGLLLWFANGGTVKLLNKNSSPQQQASNMQGGPAATTPPADTHAGNAERRAEALDCRYGIGRDIDMQEAERILTELTEEGDAVAAAHLFTQIMIGLQPYSRREEADEIWLKASDELYQLSENGDLEAGFAVACAYKGIEEEKSWSLFMDRLTNRCVEESYIPGILLRAELLMKGRHLEQDRYESIRLYQMCVDMDCVAAMTRLGNINMSEDYPEHDMELGRSMLEQAGERGDPDAWYQLAYRELEDDMDAATRDRVEHHLRKAWECGEIGASIRLVELLLHDSGPEPDLAECRRIMDAVGPELSIAPPDDDNRLLYDECAAELEQLEYGQ